MDKWSINWVDGVSELHFRFHRRFAVRLHILSSGRMFTCPHCGSIMFRKLSGKEMPIKVCEAQAYQCLTQACKSWFWQYNKETKRALLNL